MKKKYLIILGVTLALLCVLTGLLLSGVFDTIEKPIETTQPNTEVNDDGTSIYDLSAFTENKNISLPMLPTDIDGIYYTMSTKGEVGFYRLDGNEITAVAETGVYDVSVVCSNSTIPAKVHYIDIDGQKYGCGLYTSSITPGVNLYAYAFFKLTELPEEFKVENNYWLLLDIDQTRFYSEDKRYGEAFYYDVTDNTSAYFLSETQRTIAMDGVSRPDYKVFTDEILEQPQDNVLFFSGRFYNEELHKYDIFSSGGYDINKDNLRQAEDVLDMALWRAEDKFYYLTAEADSVGFSLCSWDGDTSEKLVYYDFSFTENCIRSGNYFYEKTDSKVYTMPGGEERSLSVAGTGNSFEVNMFEISENGRFALLRGEAEDDKIWIVLADLQTGETDTYCNDEFAKIAACNISDSGTIVISMADSLNATTATTYSQLIIDIGTNEAPQTTVEQSAETSSTAETAA